MRYYMEIQCKCGNIIHDDTDFMNDKGYFRSDQDEDDYFTKIDNIIYDESIDYTEITAHIQADLDNRYSRVMYVCKQCGRLFLSNHHGSMNVYVPEESSFEEPVTDILNSVEGEHWKGFLRGEWDNAIEDEYKGYLSIYVNGKESDFIKYDNFQDLKKDYYKYFEYLRQEEKLRDARLSLDSILIDSWEIDNI